MRSIQPLVSIVFLFSAGFSAAQERIFDGPGLSYTYFDFGYERRSFDDADLMDGDGGFLEFSFGGIPFIYFTGEMHYSNAESFLSGDEIDFIDADLGVGLRFTALDTISFYIEGGLAYSDFDIDVTELDAIARDDLGLYLEPGLKLGLFGRLEVNAALKYRQFEDDALLGGKVGAVIGLTDKLGITLDAGVEEESEYIGIG
ncbi:MAG: outer membrane beta-barrel protein, partial [Verrucomicrobiota bacterium]